jgi:hypothetical protein
MARFGSLPSAAGTAAATTTAVRAAAPPPAPAKPATPAATTQQKALGAARTAPPRTAPLKKIAPAKTVSPYSAESEATFGTAPGTLSIEERFSPGQALSLAQAGLLSPADTAAVRAKEADTDFYLKKLEDVERLRRQKVIGPTNAPAAMYDVHPMFQEPEGVTRSDKSAVTVAPKSGMPGVKVYPRPGNVYSPDDETMAKIEAFRDTAKLQGVEYRRAVGEVAAQGAKIEAALRDPTFDRRKLPELARAQRELVQRLADRRASLREMGFLDDKEVEARFLE